MSKKAYIHLDTETTSLDPTTGHIRSISWIVTDGQLLPIPGFDPTEVSMPVHPTLWDSDTMEWAVKQYGQDFFEAQKHNGYTAWVDILAFLIYPFQAMVDDLGKKGYEVWMVVNHPEFDVTMLRAAYELLGMDYPIRYNHHLDWQSLYLAHANCKADDLGEEPKTYKEILAWADPVKGKENVVHTALADVERQLTVLQHVGVVLPS